MRVLGSDSSYTTHWLEKATQQLPILVKAIHRSSEGKESRLVTFRTVDGRNETLDVMQAEERKVKQ